LKTPLILQVLLKGISHPPLKPLESQLEDKTSGRGDLQAVKHDSVLSALGVSVTFTQFGISCLSSRNQDTEPTSYLSAWLLTLPRKTSRFCRKFFCCP